MSKVAAKSIKLNKGSTNVTASNGTAATLSKIFDYQVPPGMMLYLDEDAVVMLKDNGATESAGASKVEIRAVPSNGLGYTILAQTTYTMVEVSQDNALKFKPVSQVLAMKPFTHLEVWINSDQTVYASASTDFYLEAKYANA